MASILGRIGDHRNALRLGRQSALDHRLARELAYRAANLRELHMEVDKATRLDRRAELRTLNAHEIDELSGAGEAKRFHRQNPGGLRDRLTNQDTGHNRTARKIDRKSVV